jgi:hypothetical protein
MISPSHKPLPANTQQTGHTSVPLAGFKPATSAIKRLQTYALDLTATGIGNQNDYKPELF